MIPNVAQAAVDQNGHFTVPWRKFFSALERAQAGGGTDVSADIAAIATALGSPDGTVANIPDTANLIVCNNGTLIVAADGNQTVIGLKALGDSGSGASLVKLTRDIYGRVAGTQAANLDDLADVAISSPVSGDVLTYNGTAFVNLAGGGGGGSSAFSLVSPTVTLGATATNITFSGLNLAVHGAYRLVISGLNANASALTINLFYNGDTTATNYRRQFLVASGASVTAAQSNNANVFDVAASAPFTGVIDIVADTSGYPRAITEVNRELPASVLLQRSAHVRNNTANVTSLTLNASVASGFAAGMRVSLYKIVP